MTHFLKVLGMGAGIAMASFGLHAGLKENDMTVARPAPTPAPALTSPLSSVVGTQQWLNTSPLGADQLRGKVVLINFWTYSCINSLRPLPYLRAWAAKYRAQGLVVIGVHTPEFSFEKEVSNVRLATEALGVAYPVVLDSDFAIWRAFRNGGWPGFHLIGADGRVRYQMIGEGDYAASERMIRQLLSEAGRPAANGAIAEIPGEGIQAAPDWASLRSPETYIGYSQARNFVSPGGAKRGGPKLYETPATPRLNQWGLAGTWTIGAEFATLGGAPGGIRYRFRARDLHLVLGTNGQPVRFRVTIDGAAPDSDHGWDTDAQGRGVVREDRLYQLVRRAGPVTERTFEIEFLDPGVRAYVFTFG